MTRPGSVASQASSSAPTRPVRMVPQRQRRWSTATASSTATDSLFYVPERDVLVRATTSSAPTGGGVAPGHLQFSAGDRFRVIERLGADWVRLQTLTPPFRMGLAPSTCFVEEALGTGDVALVRSVANYESTALEEVSFRPNELMVLKENFKSGRVLVELDGRIGLAPSDYLSDVAPATVMVANANFTDGELTILEGERITLLEQQSPSPHWVWVMRDGVRGRIPRAYLVDADAVLRSSAASVSSASSGQRQSHLSAARGSTGSNISSTSDDGGPGREDEERARASHRHSSVLSSDDGDSPVLLTEARFRPSRSLLCSGDPLLFRSRADFRAKHATQLSFAKGALLTWVQPYTDEWGIFRACGRTGFAPLCLLEMLREPILLQAVVSHERSRSSLSVTMAMVGRGPNGNTTTIPLAGPGVPCNAGRHSAASAASNRSSSVSGASMAASMTSVQGHRQPQTLLPLAFAQGDLLRLVEPIDRDTLHVRRGRFDGLVSAGAVCEITKPIIMRARRAYVPAIDSHVSFAEGTLMRLHEIANDDWALVTCSGLTGLAPLHMLEEVEGQPPFGVSGAGVGVGVGVGVGAEAGLGEAEEVEVADDDLDSSSASVESGIGSGGGLVGLSMSALQTPIQDRSFRSHNSSFHSAKSPGSVTALTPSRQPWETFDTAYLPMASAAMLEEAAAAPRHEPPPASDAVDGLALRGEQRLGEGAAASTVRRPLFYGGRREQSPAPPTPLEAEITPLRHDEPHGMMMMRPRRTSGASPYASPTASQSSQMSGDSVGSPTSAYVSQLRKRDIFSRRSGGGGAGGGGEFGGSGEFSVDGAPGVPAIRVTSASPGGSLSSPFSTAAGQGGKGRPAQLASQPTSFELPLGPAPRARRRLVMDQVSPV